MGPQRLGSLILDDRTGFSELKKYGGHQQVVKYDGIRTPRWLLEASVARSQNTIEELPEIDQWQVTDTTVVPNAITGGIGFYEQGNESVLDGGGALSPSYQAPRRVRLGVRFEW